MFTKAMPFEYKANTEKREFEGYASTYKRDLVGDQVVKGAYQKTLAERLPNNKIKILYQHSDAVGLPLEMYEDSKGLYVRGKISNTTLGNDMLELMKDGVLDEMSIGYDVVADDISEDGSTRLLKELKLYEVSIVTFGANPDTAINSVKSLSFLNELTPARLAMLLTESKAGRAVSKRNIEKLIAARAHLDEIIKLAEGDPDDLEKALRRTISTFTDLASGSRKSGTQKDAQQDFVSECMHRLHGRYPDQQQRLAICFSEWEDKKKGKEPKEEEVKALENAFDLFKNLTKAGKI
jgi:HK97 family phage prohead protease